jgi:hypothetical protein
MKLRTIILLLAAALSMNPWDALRAEAIAQLDEADHSSTFENCTHGPLRPGVDTVPKFKDVLFTDKSPDNEATIAKILTSDSFFLPWAQLAHYLGYGWVWGNTNGNTEVGREFEFRRIRGPLDTLEPNDQDDEYRYMFQAKYDPRYRREITDPIRFRIAFSKIEWMMQPESLERGKLKNYPKKPIKVTTWLFKNRGDKEITGEAQLAYSATSSWSKMDSTFVFGVITLTHTLKFNLPPFGENQTSISVQVGGGKNWATTEGNSTTTSQLAKAEVSLPPRSQQLVRIILFEEKVDVPYTANMFMDYQAELYNFLWPDNALGSHPRKVTFYLAKFGDEKEKLTAPQDLLSQYISPHISAWDWQWVSDHHCTNHLERQIGLIAKRKFRQQFKGVFEGVEAGVYGVDVGKIEPLKEKGAGTGLTYNLVEGDTKDVPGKVENLHFSFQDKHTLPSSSVSPFH